MTANEITLYRHYLTTITERDLFIERELVQKQDNPANPMMLLAVRQEIERRVECLR